MFSFYCVQFTDFPPYVLSLTSCSETISVPQEINVHFSCSSFSTITFNGFIIQWGKLKRIRTTLQWPDWVPSSISTLLSFKTCLSWERTGFHGTLWASWELPSILTLEIFPHPLSLHFPSRRLPARVKLISLLLLMEAMGLPSVCAWTTHLPLQSPPKNMFRKNKHLGLPKTLKTGPRTPAFPFLKKKIITYVDPR